MTSSAPQLVEQMMNARVAGETRYVHEQHPPAHPGMQIMYTEDHKGAWPDTLDQAVKAADVGPQQMVNPMSPDSHPGYTYIDPGKMSDIKSPSTRLVIYETKPQTTGRDIGFGDGHVEFVIEAEFQKYLKDAQEAVAHK